MNKLEARTALVKRTGRYDLVGAQLVDGSYVPDYTVDAGADAVLDAAIRSLDEQIKLRINKMKKTFNVDAGDEHIRIPGLRSIIYVQYQETSGSHPYPLDMIESKEAEHWKYVALQHASVCARPHLFYINARDTTPQVTSYTLSFPYVCPTPTPSSVTVSLCDPTATYGVKVVSTQEVFTAANTDSRVISSPATTFAIGFVLDGVSPETDYEACMKVVEVIGEATHTSYVRNTFTPAATYPGITIIPAATIDAGIVTVDGWFYTTWDSSLLTATCWWSVYDSRLLMHMAALELGIMSSDENVALAERQIEKHRRSQICDDISTEVAMLGNKGSW